MKILLILALLLPLILTDWKECHNKKTFWGTVTKRDNNTCSKYACSKKYYNCKHWVCRSKFFWFHDWCDMHTLTEDIDLAEYNGKEEGYSNNYLMLTFGFGAGLGVLAMFYKSRKDGKSDLVQVSKI